jgi:hypothetical protein
MCAGGEVLSNIGLASLRVSNYWLDALRKRNGESDRFPWVDIPDLRLFQMGFEAGVEWSLRISGNEVCRRAQDSWITAEERVFGTVWDKIRELDRRHDDASAR